MSQRGFCKSMETKNGREDKGAKRNDKMRTL